MKLRKLKTCRAKGCTNTFAPHRSTEKYCSYECQSQNEKTYFNKPKKNNKPKNHKSKNKGIKSKFSKESQLERFDKPKPKSKQIRRQSTKMKNQSYKYTKKRKVFMNKPENKICPVSSYMIKNAHKMQIDNSELMEWTKSLNTSEVHHKAARVGHLLLYTPLWLAVSSKGHKFIHNNPEFSYSMNWLLPSSKKYK